MSELDLTYENDDELFARAREGLFTAVVGDVMDMLGYTHQFLSPMIQPLRQDMVTIGRAMPVLEADDEGGEGPGRRNPTFNGPFGLMLEALDDLKKNEVYICTGASPTYALWGELMSTCAINQGAVGAVMDGYSRDTRGILALNFPVFSYGRYAQDQRPRGKVVDFRCTIQMNGVTIAPGDIIFGDVDGVCVVPRAIEDDVMHRAWKKAHGEKRVFEAIKGGMKAQTAWDTFGIL
jgi:regulator of RNase E activity RraA